MVGLLSPAPMGPAQRFLLPGAPAAPAAPVMQQQAPMGGGLLSMFAPKAAQSPFYQAFDQRRNAISNMLLGGVGAETPLERMRGMAQGLQRGGQADMLYAAEMKKQRENQRAVSETVRLLTEKRPDLVPWVQSGAIDPKTAFNVLFDKSGKTTDDITEYQLAVQQGFQGTFPEYMIEMKKAGAPSTNVTVGGGKYGTIPQGYELVEGPQGATLRAIPGGPEDTSRKDALRAGQAQITSDTVIDAANKAREAMDASWLPTTGTAGRVASMLSESGAAEVQRQVDALRAVAASENINAMRQASPTGGALGNASDADIKLLKDKAGALDPGAGRETFMRQLDDYERTLLRIVHGPELGDIIYQQTRKQGSEGGWVDLGGGVRLRRKPD